MIMASKNAAQSKPASAAELQLERIEGSGSVRHPHLAALLECNGPHTGRDLADSIHLLCALHGCHPSLIEIAFERATSPALRDWLGQARDGFERERLYLVRLTAAVGPIPSTPGAPETEASLNSARHALETLASSERGGCALGAATALVGDWWPIRRLLDRTATRAGIESPAPSLPDESSLVATIHQVAEEASAARALAFGGEQLLLQHRALFDLLEARASARGEF